MNSVAQFLQNREIGLPKTYTRSLELFFEIRDEIDFLCDVIDENTDIERTRLKHIPEMRHLKKMRLRLVKRIRRKAFLEEKRKRFVHISFNTHTHMC